MILVGVETGCQIRKKQTWSLKTPKSTYYDKWGPSDSWTMAASIIRKLF